MDYKQQSPFGCYVDRDGVPVPVDLEGNEITDEGEPKAGPQPASAEVVPETETKRGSK